MSVDYNKFAKTFSKSRKNMKWEEIDYFISFLDSKIDISILDIWCGNWRFLWVLKDKSIDTKNYLWVDLSDWLLQEAKNIYTENNFLQLNMLDLDKIPLSKSFPPREKDLFDYIFFIASFHHLDNLKDRFKVLKKAKKLLKNSWKIFMTNWALNSELNNKKYKNSIISWTDNKFWSLDYNIKIWEYNRYYHCFSLDELSYLFEEVWFEVIENKLFENNRNFISIIQKKWD